MYLVDYGLAYRYCPDGVHKEYKEDPKRCHDGTLEFTSIDAHNGVGMSCCVYRGLVCPWWPVLMFPSELLPLIMLSK